MTHSNLRIWILLALLAVPAASATAQQDSSLPEVVEDIQIEEGQDPEAAAVDGNSSLPSLADVFTLINKRNNDPNAAGSEDDWSSPVKLAVVFAGLAILPSLLVMVTSFTRIVIVLSFVRRALSTQTIPPTIAVIGLALFLTLFTMAPTLTRLNDDALQPYLNDEIPFARAAEIGNDRIKEFMIRQTREKDLELFVNMAKVKVKHPRDIPMHVVIPSFAISEFRTAFEMGCLLFIPFLLIDLVIAGILLSAGMMMLPPMMVSLPFKIILFVLVDGWQLVVVSLVKSFY